MHQDAVRQGASDSKRLIAKYPTADFYDFCPFRMQRGRLGGIEPRGFRNVCQRPYNRWPEAHACKSHTHALGSPLRWPPAHPTRKRVLVGRQAGWSAECQQCVWVTKMRQTRKPLARTCVQNTYLEAESRFRSVAAWSGSRIKPK